MFTTPDNCSSLTDSVSINTMCNRVIIEMFPELPVNLVSTPASLSAVDG